MPSIPKIPGEDRKEHKVFREFGGINTQAARQAIKDDEFAWLENVIPIGYANAKVVPAPSSTLATHTGSGYFYKPYNINGTPYVFVATTAGAASSREAACASGAMAAWDGKPQPPPPCPMPKVCMVAVQLPAGMAAAPSGAISSASRLLTALSTAASIGAVAAGGKLRTR